MAEPAAPDPIHHFLGPVDPSQYQIKNEDKEFLYAAISPDEDVIKQRVLDVQQKAYKEHAYPCIRLFFFVALRMKRMPAYKEVLERGKRGGGIFLEIGSCMGTELRNLVHDGYPVSQIVGCDFHETYISLGYELFQDKETCKIKFVADDAFNVGTTLATAPAVTDVETVSKLDDLAGRVSFIYTSSMFHLFDEAKQKELAKRMVRLWTREPGAIIFGRHQALEQAGNLSKGRPGWNSHGHSPASWETMWKEAFEEVEGEGASEKIIVTAILRQHTLGAILGTQTLVWSIRRI